MESCNIEFPVLFSIDSSHSFVFGLSPELGSFFNVQKNKPTPFLKADGSHSSYIISSRK